MNLARIILTAAPTISAVKRAAGLLNFAALTAAGHEATARGEYIPAEVGRRAEALVASWVDAVTHAAPLPDSTARMIASAISMAGTACRVEVVG